MKKLGKILVTGQKEKEILTQILQVCKNDEEKLKVILEDYEKSTGLDSLKDNLSKYFDVV